MHPVLMKSQVTGAASATAREIIALLTSTSMGPSCVSIFLTTLAQALKIGDIELDRNAALLVELLRGLVVAAVSRRNVIAGVLQRY